MCNLYSLTKMPDGVRQLFKVPDNRATICKPQDAIFPGYEAPIVRLAEAGERELVMINWGFIVQQAGKAPRRVQIR